MTISNINSAENQKGTLVLTTGIKVKDEKLKHPYHY